MRFSDCNGNQGFRMKFRIEILLVPQGIDPANEKICRTKKDLMRILYRKDDQTTESSWSFK